MKYYISCPVSVDYENILYVEELIRQNDSDAQVIYWERNSLYRDYWIEECDHFIIMLPDNKFECVVENLPSGVLRELRRAEKMKKSICMAYKNITYKKWNIYNTCRSMFSIGGLAGTPNRVFSNLPKVPQVESKKYPLTPKECYSAPTMQEKRLLLFLK